MRATRPTTPPTRDLRLARLAVAVVFTANGAAFANWVPRIPEVKADLGLTPELLGLALLGAGAGALVGSGAAGPLTTRVGTRRATVAGGVGLCAAMPLVALAGGWPPLFAALAVFGLLDAITDIAMNAQAVVVERRYERSIMHGFHAWWSVGAVLGAVMGSAAAGLGIPLGIHLLGTGVLLGGSTLVVGRWLLPAAADRVAPLPGADPGARPGRRRALLGSMGLLIVLAVFASVAEGAPGDWSAVYLAGGLGVPAGAAGLGFAAFSATMLLSRTIGDRVVDRWGVVRTVRVALVLGAAGLGGALLVADPVIAVAGFACFGLGMGTVSPAMYGAAGRVPGVTAGAGIAVMSLASRSGFLVGPPLIGVVAGAAGLDVGLAVAVLAALTVAGLAGTLGPSRRASSSRQG